MKSLRINSALTADTTWNNQYTLFSESVGLLQRLISTESFSGEEDTAANLMEKHLKARNITVKRRGNNVWAYNKYYDPEKPTILLNSHLDTVKPCEGYTRDPFSPEIADSRLYGLGSNDAGGCLISLMATFFHYYHQQRMGFNLCFAATAEEETSGENGIRLVLPQLGRLDFAIIGEPTLLQMAVTEKGNMVIDCTCKGRSGHAAREEGDNAIYKCMADLEWFRNYRFNQASGAPGPVKMTVTGIKAGLQHNIVPGICEFTVDIRNDDVFSHEQILKTIESNIHSQFTVRPARLKASSVSLKHPLIKAGVALGCKTYDSPTSSDRAWLNCPSIKLGPGDSARSHMPDEFIFLEEIKKGINLYIRLLERLPSQLINNPFLAQNEINPLNN
jgi:acetylornithine deacetylase